MAILKYSLLTFSRKLTAFIYMVKYFPSLEILFLHIVIQYSVLHLSLKSLVPWFCLLSKVCKDLATEVTVILLLACFLEAEIVYMYNTPSLIYIVYFHGNTLIIPNSLEHSMKL